jgi:hypothetical protein
MEPAESAVSEKRAGAARAPAMAYRPQAGLDEIGNRLENVRGCK